MSGHCGKCGTRLPEDTVYPEYCCDTPSSAAQVGCNCGGWKQPWCQECQDIELARRMAHRMTVEQRNEVVRAIGELDDDIHAVCGYPQGIDFSYYTIVTYHAAQAYIGTVDRLFPEVGQ